MLVRHGEDVDVLVGPPPPHALHFPAEPVLAEEDEQDEEMPAPVIDGACNFGHQGTRLERRVWEWRSDSDDDDQDDDDDEQDMDGRHLPWPYGR